MRFRLLLTFAALLATAAQAQPSSAAARQVRERFYRLEYDAGFREGTALLARTPGDAALRAWTILNQGRAGYALESQRAADSLARRAPGSPWSTFATAFVLGSRGDQPRQTLALARTLLAAHPRNPDFAWLHTWAYDRWRKYDAAVAFADSVLPRLADSSNVLLAKGAALMLKYMNARGRDSTVAAQALAVFERARRAAPTAGALHAGGSALLTLGRAADAYPLLRRAAEMAPASPEIHESYWHAVVARKDVAAEEQQREIEADLAAATRGGESEPRALQMTIAAYRRLRLADRAAAAEQRLLDEHPNSLEAERVRYGRISALGDSVARKLVADSARGAAEHRRRLREFVERPVHPSGYVLGQAYYYLYNAVREDSSLGDAELVKLAEGMTEYTPFFPGVVGVMVPLQLADRSLRLDLAERLVRSKIARRERDAEEMYEVGIYGSVGEYAQALDLVRAGTHDALGWIAYKAGRRADAERELAKALELAPRQPSALHHLGQIREAAGRVEEAKRLYARGLAAERATGPRPIARALQRLHLAQGGTASEFETWVAELRDAERAERRRRIAATRAPNGRAMPAFELERLEGGRFSSAALRGKIAVVNFWGTWCSPCVAEAPDLQKLHERLKGDSDVVFITIDAEDPSPQVVRDFMAKRKLDFPVLLDDKFARRAAAVGPFPTTWFVDRDGRIAFQHEGGSDQVFEEFLWRVEMLKGGPPVGGR